ncbi:hypothetical protein MCOR27_001042 [Pyricularia oryzae]|uniref:Uncharacterized protein n=1 Tax=Pyricularia oryzae TaxID=318829 RepID=A0A4P7NJZ8_PYROR|nr:hypothetical protein MCOR02_006179 [Pyricularia oryzae]KAI6277626.1 hypothetical protein MCOR26_005017 [Pyricularia oryzae]KAI6287769.1 hypothetical protein MCOR34_010861 [Pyricularia oryzae]KAI6288016.1 hypothetical protein MCOR27_001042 [Pyricularia oryzae]KAI6345855.1 hypothetical protein MCOR28_003370 [Pyricularia oryzae]
MIIISRQTAIAAIILALVTRDAVTALPTGIPKALATTEPHASGGHNPQIERREVALPAEKPQDPDAAAPSPAALDKRAGNEGLIRQMALDAGRYHAANDRAAANRAAAKERTAKKQQVRVAQAAQGVKAAPPQQLPLGAAGNLPQPARAGAAGLPPPSAPQLPQSYGPGASSSGQTAPVAPPVQQPPPLEKLAPLRSPMRPRPLAPVEPPFQLGLSKPPQTGGGSGNDLRAYKIVD